MVQATYRVVAQRLLGVVMGAQGLLGELQVCARVCVYTYAHTQPPTTSKTSHYNHTQPHTTTHKSKPKNQQVIRALFLCGAGAALHPFISHPAHRLHLLSPSRGNALDLAAGFAGIVVAGYEEEAAVQVGK